MVTGGLSDQSRYSVSQSMKEDKQEMLKYINKMHTNKNNNNLIPENSRKPKDSNPNKKTNTDETLDQVLSKYKMML